MNKDRLAIIGAGVTGLGIAKVFVDKGWKVTIFDRESEPGGTWCKKYLYGDLKLHSKTGTYLFPGFPFHDKNHDVKKLSASGEQVNEYIKQYIQHNALDKLIVYDANVSKLTYNHKKDEVRITYSNKNNEKTFDFVVVTGHTTNLNMPNFAGVDKFKGQIIHSSLASQSILKSAISEGKRVAVLGGNKSATDMVNYFASRDYKNLTWIHRKTHWFLKEEKMRPCFDALLFLSVVYILFKYGNKLKEKNLGRLCRLIAKRQVIINPRGGSSESFLKMFHSGIMEQGLFDTLQNVEDKQGEIKELTEDSVILESGEKIPCDILICATGYDARLGFPAIDDVDESGLSHAAELLNAAQLYRGHIHPAYPRIGFAHKRSVFFGAPSVAAVTGSWFYKYFNRVIEQPKDDLYKQIVDELKCEKVEYRKHRLSYGEPFKGAYVEENIWFWFLYMQSLYRKDLKLPRFYFLRFILKLLAKETDKHSMHVGV